MHGRLETAPVGETECCVAGRNIPSVPLTIVVGCMLAGAAYAYAVGDDTNWDWRNYHAYNVWATINNRYDTDVIPAGFQTYFNPLIYYPIYLLRQLLSPLWAGLIAGAVHGLNLVAIYSLTRALLGSAANAAAISNADGKSSSPRSNSKSLMTSISRSAAALLSGAWCSRSGFLRVWFMS